MHQIALFNRRMLCLPVAKGPKDTCSKGQGKDRETQLASAVTWHFANDVAVRAGGKAVLS